MLANAERNFIMFVSGSNTLLEVQVRHVQAALRLAFAHRLAHRACNTRVSVQDAISGQRGDPICNRFLAACDAVGLAKVRDN